jgi:HEAT repeat protein
MEKIGDARAVEQLAVLLNGGDREIRQAAARALARIGDERAVVPFVVALKHYDVRDIAIRALIKFGRTAMEPLIAALEDNEPAVRQSIAYALGDIGDARAVAPLIEVLKDKASARFVEAGLRVLLEHAASSMSPAHLRLVASVDNTCVCLQPNDCGHLVDGTLDCTQIKQLARQELIRRGLKG